ncbi:hypothetical protein Fmac_018848 [Flemingia macrophylla]|uniref:F-box domain-containing protein n=1 Tax=Flemingia macrophylla TaxID=520843 RepID=A0ABD1M678_9FABA
MLESSASFDIITISARKQNLLKRQKINENEDMMNKLPEPLISRILSLLPTKDAVRTSVLSKKWVFRWTFITKLALDDAVFYSPKKKTGVNMSFTNFVYRVFLLTQNISLESFSLVIANQYDASLLNTCISNILRRAVKSLHIRTRFKMPVSSLTSHSLFKSTLLEELVLSMESCAIRVATGYVYFGFLRLLKLSGISFTPDPNLNCLKLSLPVLKVFESTNCTWLNVKVVDLKAPLLERVIVVQNGKSMSYGTPKCAIMKISASNLTEFSYSGDGYISHYLGLSNSSLAHNASLNVTVNQFPINKDPETKTRVFWLLKQFSQVKYLKFMGCEVSILP